MKYLILENIRGAYNVGAIFRTADGAGVSKIFLIGHTPTPIDRFGRVQKEIAKTSLGASATIEWEHHDTVTEVIEKLKIAGVKIVAIEQSDNSISIKDFAEPDEVAYVVGNEIDGVSTDALNMADTIIEIPMLGQKESLNLSVAVGVVLYHGVITK